MPRIWLIAGMMAAGKSTVAQALAERLERSVHLRGDTFRKMIVNGREDMTPTPSDEALAQLSLRYRLSTAAAIGYAEAGFNVVYQDVILGDFLADVTALLAPHDLAVVVLAPSLEVLSDRDRRRGKSVYGSNWTPELLHAVLAATPDLGLRLDTSRDSVAQTVERILAGVSGARIPRTRSSPQRRPGHSPPA